MFAYLSIYDIIGSAVIALFIFWLIKASSKLFRVVLTRSMVFSFSHKNLENVLDKCHMLFPIEQLSFNGVIFKRGMEIQITSLKKTTVIGKFIGTNHENVLCVITKDKVVAQEMAMIEAIRQVELS